MLRPEDRVTYAQAVWDTFTNEYQIKRFTMTSAEFQLVRTWMDESIPLAIVFRGITETGTKNSKPRTLLACEQPVKRAIEYWAQAAGLTGGAA